MNTAVPRPEHPTPQWARPGRWLNLNGAWDFEIDHACTGRERSLPSAESLSGQILVPFCPESKLSGVGYTDFMASVWYRRGVTLPEEWRGGRILLHFGAADYHTEVWIDGVSAGTHTGGYTPFDFDITALLGDKRTFAVTVCAADDTRSPAQASGKQSMRYGSHGCFYTRTTGIWQTVWLEHVPDVYIKKCRITPDLANSRVHLDIRLSDWRGGMITAAASFDGVTAARLALPVRGTSARVTLGITDPKPWSPDSPALYDLTLTLAADGQTDTVNSYFGLRDVSLDGGCLTVNGKRVFQRLILDQGFYPEGIYTAPDDGDIRKDIELSMACGFNGARLHQKVFEPRTLYWADKLGYLLWDEFPNWGLNIDTSAASHAFISEWLTVLERDYNSPAVIGWCPFNETHPGQHGDVLRLVYDMTKVFDPTRPVIDTSGYVHVVTDIYDVHDYGQDPEAFAARYAGLPESVHQNYPEHERYGGQPYFVSEYGGIWWSDSDDSGWGYGDRVKSIEEFYARFEGLTAALLCNPHICALCYTQLTDVEQEQNGLYAYDRQPKFDAARLAAAMSATAAVETRESV